MSVKRLKATPRDNYHDSFDPYLSKGFGNRLGRAHQPKVMTKSQVIKDRVLYHNYTKQELIQLAIPDYKAINIKMNKAGLLGKKSEHVNR